MRTSLALGLFACVLALAGSSGCSALSKKRAGGGGTGQPFVGSPSGNEPASTPENPDNTFVSKQIVKPGKGMVAGQVKDTANRGVPDAAIKITEAETGKEPAIAPLTILTDKSGYFDVPGLDAGRTYVLSARKRDGNRYMTGSVRVRCTNVSVILPLAGEEAATGGEKASLETYDREEKGSPASPAALGSPTPTKGPTAYVAGPTVVPDEPKHAPAPRHQEPEVPPPPPPQQPEFLAPVPSPLKTPAFPAPPPSANLETFAEGVKGFTKSPAANMPGPGQELKKQHKPTVPPPPMSDGSLVPSTPNARLGQGERPGASDDLAPLTRVVVPSCVVRDRVESFALHDYDGRAWQWKKRKGRLTLVSFFYSQCGPCKPTILFLNQVRQKYEDYGLDVIGVANEAGTPIEKQDAVRRVRAVTPIDYPVLFTGGPNCPVMRGLDVHAFPTVVVLDDTGRIVWRSRNGMPPETMRQLDQWLAARLRR